MIVGIYHSISNPQKFGEVVAKVDTLMKEGDLPEGIKGLTFAPSTDGRKAFCLWEAESVESLKAFLEPISGLAARNEYYEVDLEKAEGLTHEALAHRDA